MLRERGLEMVAPLVEAPSPQAARREAHSHRAPILVSRHVLVGHAFHELPVEGLKFEREFVLVLPAYGEPAANVAQLAEQLHDVAARWRGRCATWRSEPAVM